jgi:molecular chaperone GrpE
LSNSSQAKSDRPRRWRGWFGRPEPDDQARVKPPTVIEPDYIRVLHERLNAQERQLTELTAAVQALTVTVTANNGSKTAPSDYRPEPHSANSARLEQLLAFLNENSLLTITDLTTLAQSLAGLEKQINRAGKEQLRTGTVLEAQQTKIEQVLEKMEEAQTLYQAELQNLQEQQQARLSAARLEALQALFPVLDSLDEALRSGHQLLTQVPPPTRKGWFAPPVPVETPLREGMQAWLEGLTLVQQRLLDVLAGGGIQPLKAQGQPFDPHYQVALEVVPATGEYPSGTVVAEIRRGYVLGEKVLRYAEVTVSR